MIYGLRLRFTMTIGQICIECSYNKLYDLKQKRRHSGRDRMVVGFITTYAMSAYHH